MSIPLTGPDPSLPSAVPSGSIEPQPEPILPPDGTPEPILPPDPGPGVPGPGSDPAPAPPGRPEPTF